jgi:bacterioferritin-associated ferredoxin
MNVIVCSCHAVSDSALRKLANSGATLDEVQRLTAAGTACGCCRTVVHDVVATERGGCGKSTPCPGCTRRTFA